MFLRRLFRGRLLEGAGDDGGDGGDGGEGGDGDKGGEGDGGEGRTTLLGAGDGGEGGTGDGQWFWQEGMQGEGDAPPWFKSDKWQTIDAQARAAVELEAKIGPAAELIGAPEGDYAIPETPEGVEGGFDAEDPLLVGFTETAKELGLSQKAFDAVVTKMAGVIALQNQAADEKLSEALASLGPNANARIAAVDNYIIQAHGQDAYAALQAAIGDSVDAYKVVEQLVAKASGDAQLAAGMGQTGVAFTKTDAETERYKTYPEGHKLAGRVMYEHDKDHRAKVDKMFKDLFPGQDNQVVG